MLCDRCGETVEAGDEKAFHSEMLCEDCYMDVLSPARICDPWAVHNAKSSLGTETPLTRVQQEIISILTDSGGAGMATLVTKLDLKAKEVERNLAALRHMEKIKARPENGQKVFCLWS